MTATVALWHVNPTILEIQQEEPQGDVKQTNKELGPAAPLV